MSDLQASMIILGMIVIGIKIVRMWPEVLDDAEWLDDRFEEWKERRRWRNTSGGLSQKELRQITAQMIHKEKIEERRRRRGKSKRHPGEHQEKQRRVFRATGDMGALR